MLFNLGLWKTHTESPSKVKKLYINVFPLSLLYKLPHVEPANLTLSSLKKVSSLLPLSVKY
jgi:hypothetical protein